MQKFVEKFTNQPIWLSLLLLFAAFMTFVYIPWDFFFKPVAQDQEVWFGFVLTGWAAKATEPLHWLIYAAATYGIWLRKPWVFIGISLYFVQVAIGMLVWNAQAEQEFGLLIGIVTAIPFVILAIALWRSGVANKDSA